MANNTKEMLEESSKVKKELAENYADKVKQAADVVVDCLKNGKKILLAGNGGSATQASHIAAEFTGRYKLDRRALPAIALTTDLGAITAIANDYGYDAIFERKVEAWGREGDILIALSTSGNSENVNRGIKKAKDLGMEVISLIGKDGGKQKSISDIGIIVPSDNTPRIQEAHITILHIICELVENELFGKGN